MHGREAKGKPGKETNMTTPATTEPVIAELDCWGQIMEVLRRELPDGHSQLAEATMSYAIMLTGGSTEDFYDLAVEIANDNGIQISSCAGWCGNGGTCVSCLLCG